MNTLISELKNKSLFMENISNSNKAQKGQNKDNFTEIFDKTKNAADTYEADGSVKTEENGRTDKVENPEEMNVRNSKASEKLKEQGQAAKNTDIKKSVDETVKEAAYKMEEQIAEVFGVTVEEIELVLENLGLAMVDLLNPENLTQVVLALNPEYDALALMTNEELYLNLKGLMDMAQKFKEEITQTYELPEEDLNFVLDSVKEEAMQWVQAEDIVTNVDDVEHMEVEKPQYGKTNVEFAEKSIYDATVVPNAENSQDVTSDSKGNREDSGKEAEQFAGQSFMNRLAESVENANASKGTETFSYEVRGQEIIDQITEQIRVHVKQDATEMELQLHPASLGSVKVQITSSGGVLTAVFTTENESVKAALESQLIQLKENFAQQGLKVESVEVNVSAQGFERSLDQQEQEQKRFEENKNRKGTRRIRLGSLEEAEDLFSEDMAADDKIVADMMMRNGNTVDYTV